MAETLPLSSLSEAEAGLLGRLRVALAVYRAKNATKQAFYEGKQTVAQLNISIPPSLAGIETVVGWPAAVVDVLEERLDLRGWVLPGDDDLGLGDVFTGNDLALQSSLAHLDALIYGTGFLTVGTGEPGEPDPLVTVASPMSTTAVWDARTRRVSAALTEVSELNVVTGVEDVVQYVLYLPGETVTVERSNMTVVDRDRHNLGRPLVHRLINRPWGAAQLGRSEITPAVRTFTNHAVRTLLGAEVAREFYSAPQRYLLGVDEDAFVDADGNPVPAWQTYMGRILALSRDEGGELPQAGQFPASSPQPYWDSLRALSQMVAGEGGMPATYLGFVTDNPASADAIRAGEVRLIKRAERRHSQFAPTWRGVAQSVFMVREGVPADRLPAELGAVALSWGDPATPTVAASTDAAVKLIAAGVLAPDSSVTYERVGLTPSEQERLGADKRRAGAVQVVTALREAARAVPVQPPAAGA